MKNISEIFEKAEVVCIEEGNWSVHGIKKKEDDKGAMNLGNYKTVEEAQALRDFINAGIKSGMEKKTIQYLADALEHIIE